MTHSFHPSPAFLETSNNEFTPERSDSSYAGLTDALGVQTRMFPSVLPTITSLDQAYDRRAAREVTGDYFDCFAMPGGSLGLAIGEVSGTGMPAAFMTPVLHSLIRGIGMASDQSLAEVARKTSETFSRISPAGCLATLFIAELDSVRGRLRYVNAGHEPPLVLRTAAQRNRTVLLEATGPMIGMLRRSWHQERVCMLAPGDLLVAMTDGVCDAELSSGQVWGRDHLLRLIRGSDGLPARLIVDQIFSELDRATNNSNTRDDMTLWLGRLQPEVRKPRTMSDSRLEETSQSKTLDDLIGAVA